jgi:hypothetical protein
VKAFTVIAVAAPHEPSCQHCSERGHSIKRLLCLVVVGLLVNAICGAQSPADSHPARTNVLGAEYPRVTDDGRAIFRLKASGAQKVQADITGITFDMTKDADGVWTGTTAPLAQRLRAASVQVGHRRPI